MTLTPEGRRGHAAEARGGPRRNLPAAVTPDDLIKARRRGKHRPPELHPARLGGGDSFALARADVFALRFGDEREYLQHQVGDEHGKQSARCGRVEKRHVKNAHMD